jgi:hypothetical protein
MTESSFREVCTRLGNTCWEHTPCGERITWMDGISRFGWGQYKRRWMAEHRCPADRSRPQAALPTTSARATAPAHV